MEDTLSNGKLSLESRRELESSWMDFVHFDAPESEMKAALEGEISNFRLLNAKISQIGCIPPMRK